VRLLVLPESALGGYLREPGPEASALDIPAGLDPEGPEIARLIELAGDVVVCAGSTEAGDGVLHGSAVCEAARALALDGADVICSLSAWPADRLNPGAELRDDIQTRHFDLCDQTRAVENQVFVVSANQTGPWGPLHFLGSAKVVDPAGAVLASTGPAEGLAIADVDLAAVHEIRLGIDHLADRRPDAYAPPVPAAAVLGFAR
jgi:N-carbamoylputrescine amidase